MIRYVGILLTLFTVLTPRGVALPDELLPPASERSVRGRAAQALALLVPGGPARTVGTYSTSWMRPSKVRLLIMSRATSG